MSKMITMVAMLALVGCADSMGEADATAAIQAPPPTAPTMTLDAPAAGRIGGSVQVIVSGAPAGATIQLFRGLGVGEGRCGANPGGACASLINVTEIAGVAQADGSGRATFTVNVPANAPLDRETFFQAGARDGAAVRVSNVERVRASDGSARVRVVHASPDAPMVDIYANGGLLVPGLDWLAGTPYVHVPAGTYTIDIRGAGAPANSPPVFTTSVTLAEDSQSTAIAAGFLGSAAPADAFRVLALDDAWGSPFANEARVRIVHASGDAPTVGIDVGNDGSNEVPALARFADTGADGVPLPAGVSLQVAATAGGAIPFTLPAFNTGDRVLAIATGRLATRANEVDAFGLLALGPDGVIGFIRQNPTVHIFHGSPNAPTVDIKAGAATLADNLSFRAISGAIQVPPGAYALDIYDETGTAYVTTVQTPELTAGGSYLATATGIFGGNPGFTVVYNGDTSILDDSVATLQVLHASPDAPTVEVGALLGGFVSLTGPLSYPNEADRDGVAVAPGTYDLGVALPNGTVLFDFPGITLNAGDRYFAVANGLVGAGDFGVTLIDMTSPEWTAATVFPTP
jgi:hypothetical protein